MSDVEEPESTFDSEDNFRELLTELRTAASPTVDQLLGKKPKERNSFLKWFDELFLTKLWKAAKKRVLASVEASDPLAYSDLREEKETVRHLRLKMAKRSQTLRLRRSVAYWAIFFVTVQLVCSNWFFFRFLEAREYGVEPQVMIAWLSASVVEVIGILVVIARSLFPRRDRGKSENGNSDTVQ